MDAGTLIGCPFAPGKSKLLLLWVMLPLFKDGRLLAVAVDNDDDAKPDNVRGRLLAFNEDEERIRDVGILLLYDATAGASSSSSSLSACGLSKYHSPFLFFFIFPAPPDAADDDVGGGALDATNLAVIVDPNVRLAPTDAPPSPTFFLDTSGCFCFIVEFLSNDVFNGARGGANILLPTPNPPALAPKPIDGRFFIVKFPPPNPPLLILLFIKPPPPVLLALLPLPPSLRTLTISHSHCPLKTKVSSTFTPSLSVSYALRLISLFTPEKITPDLDLDLCDDPF